MSDRVTLDPDASDAFWQFVHERQRVWYRRVVRGDDPPWTSDDALRRYRFTNVYRALDPGTQYAIHSILERPASTSDRLFNLLLYRLVGRHTTHADVGFQRLDAFDVDDFERSLRARRDGGGEPVFTGAYLVSGYAGMGGADKVANVARLFGAVRDRFDAFTARVDAATHPEDVYDAILDLPGFGNFLAYQVLVDCTYPLSTDDEASATADDVSTGRESLLPFSPNAWAVAGPGAKRGLALLSGDAGERDDLAVMRWLWRNQAREFERLGLAFDWLRDEAGERVALSLADVQNCCCEFHKYEKVKRGTGRARRRFRAGERRSADELRGCYSGYPISMRVEHYEGGPD